MTKHWRTAALLTSALAAGCAGGTENAQNSEPAAAPAPAASTAPAPEAPPAAQPAAPASPAPAARPAPARRPAPSSSSASSAPAPRPAAERPVERAAEPARPTYRDVAAAAGTPMSLELITPVSSETAQVEDALRARVKQALVVDGFTVIPAGAVLHGNVTEVERAGRVKGRSHLAFRFTQVENEGQRDQLRTAVLSFDGEASKKSDAT